MNKRKKIIIIALLVIAVTAMAIWKNQDDREVLKTSSEEILPENTLAIVSGKEITKTDFEENFQGLPAQYQEMFSLQKDEYLNQLIIRELLLQETERRGLSKENDETPDQAFQKLFVEVVGEPEVTQDEITVFYNQNKDQMPGTTLETSSEQVKGYLQEQKKGEIFDQFIVELRENTLVKLNKSWIAEQVALRPKTPLDDLLTNGLPTVLDLGSDSCIPCKMMKPIFAELEEELAEKVNILILDVSEYSNLADKYQVRVIPTQIFFDANGKQYWRHEGFLAKEDILKKLKETGAEL